MKIDYYCFITEDLKQGINTEKVNINTTFFKNLDFDIKVAKKLKKFAIYDKKTNEFYDQENNIISLRDKNIFPRCTIPDINILYDKLEEVNALPIITKKETESVYSWPRYIQPLYRDVLVMTYGEFLRDFEKYKDTYERVFFKTKNKNIHCEVLSVINLQGMAFKSVSSDEDILNGQDEKFDNFFSEPMYMVMTDKVKGFNDHRFNFLDKNQEVFVQKRLDIVKDIDHKEIPVEYRSFVIDGKFITSRSWVKGKQVPKEVTKLVQLYIDNIPNEMPKTFVLDVLEFEENGEKKYDICEFNPITCSGYEEGSSIFLLEENFNKEEMGYHQEESFECDK